MYCYKTYRRFLPLMVALHAGAGLCIYSHPKVKITINNNPEWLVMTKVIVYSALWGSMYPVTLPITICFCYIIRV
jgi:hypothetical protein